MGYSDRIVGLERVRAGDLLANEANWRTHPDSQVSALRGLLSDVGWAQALLAYRSNGDLKLIDGHLRAGLDPDEQVPVLILDVDEAEAEKLLVSIDPLAAMAEADSQALRSLLERVETADAGLGALLADLNAQAAPKQGRTDPDDVPEDVEPRTKLGDLWLLGEHRLLCGDIMDEDAWEHLCGEEEVTMVFTDPPYNVDYGSSKDPRHKIRPMEGDRQGDTDWLEFSSHLARMVRARCAGDVYCFGAPGPDGMRSRLAFVDEGFHWSATIIWKKQQLVLSPANYQRMYEPCLYGWFGRSSFVADRKQVEVWEFDRPHDSPLHPTMKPVALCAHAIQNSSKGGGVVLDPFAGSGSTLIAAEQTRRACYTMEIEPRYCDVTVARWEAFTGDQAVLA